MGPQGSNGGRRQHELLARALVGVDGDSGAAARPQRVQRVERLWPAVREAQPAEGAPQRVAVDREVERIQRGVRAAAAGRGRSPATTGAAW